MNWLIIEIGALELVIGIFCGMAIQRWIDEPPPGMERIYRLKEKP